MNDLSPSWGWVNELRWWHKDPMVSSNSNIKLPFLKQDNIREDSHQWEHPWCSTSDPVSCSLFILLLLLLLLLFETKSKSVVSVSVNSPAPSDNTDGQSVHGEWSPTWSLIYILTTAGGTSSIGVWHNPSDQQSQQNSPPMQQMQQPQQGMQPMQQGMMMMHPHVCTCLVLSLVIMTMIMISEAMSSLSLKWYC